MATRLRVATPQCVSGGVLLSHRVAPAVPSALRVLASGFGMCPGVSLVLWPPKLLPHPARPRCVGWVCGLDTRTVHDVGSWWVRVCLCCVVGVPSVGNHRVD